MNWRTTGILAGVLVLLGAVVFWQSRREPTPDPIPTPAVSAPVPVPLVSGITAVDIKSVEVVDLVGGDVREIEVDDAGLWYQIVPTRTTLITTTLQAQISGLARFQSRRSIEVEANPLSAYGLDNPSHQFAVRANKEGNSVRYGFLVGNQTPTGDGYFILKEGDKRVHVVATTNIQNMLNLLESPPFLPMVEE